MDTSYFQAMNCLGHAGLRVLIYSCNITKDPLDIARIYWKYDESTVNCLLTEIRKTQ